MNGHLYDSSSNIHNINKLLENEMVNNKKNLWIKLDKKMKTQKLHIYAEKYGKGRHEVLRICSKQRQASTPSAP